MFVCLFYLWGFVLREYKNGEDLNFLHPQVSFSLRFLKQFTHCFFGMCAVLRFWLRYSYYLSISKQHCVSKNVPWLCLLNWKLIVKTRTTWVDDITHEVSMFSRCCQGIFLSIHDPNMLVHLNSLQFLSCIYLCLLQCLDYKT